MSERRLGVLIANSSFQHERKLKQLRCPQNDVRGLDEILTSEEYGVFHETVVLQDEDSYKVLQKINETLRQATREDLVLIYYSGHGKLDSGGRLHLATADTREAILESTSIPMERIRNFIDNSDSTKVVLVLDCCYAGAVTKDFFKGDLDGQLQVVSQEEGRGIYIITASTETQVAKEKESDKYSLMTKHIIEGVRGGEVEANEDGLVSVDRLYRYVHDKVVQEGQQEPTRFGRDVRGELFIARSDKTPSEKRRKQIRKLLFDLAAQERLPDRILDKAREVVALEPTQLTGKDRRYNDLLEQLSKNRIDVWDFIEEWYKVTSEVTEAATICRLFIHTEPKDATVRILNIRGKFDQGMELEPGSYHVEVSADGYETQTKWIDIGAGEDKRIHFKLIEIETPSEKKYTNSIGMTFMPIPAGTFMMGSPAEEPEREDDEILHKVTITKPFYLQATTVTQWQWKKVLRSNPSRFNESGEDCPVENVSWQDAQKFISKLNKMENTNKYRLPTEAEWEYACRAGTTTPFHTGDSISTDQANYDGGYPMPGSPKGKCRESTVKVGTFAPNAWGLYEMHGNVGEWCQDRYGDYPKGSVEDPKGPSTEDLRVLRGGSWASGTWNLRSASRFWHSADIRHSFGFRVARDL